MPNHTGLKTTTRGLRVPGTGEKRTVDDPPHVGPVERGEERRLPRVVKLGRLCAAGARFWPSGPRLRSRRRASRARAGKHEDLLPQVKRALGHVPVTHGHREQRLMRELARAGARELERVEAAAHVAVGHLDEDRERVVVHLERLLCADGLETEHERRVAARLELHHLGHLRVGVRGRLWVRGRYHLGHLVGARGGYG